MIWWFAITKLWNRRTVGIDMKRSANIFVSLATNGKWYATMVTSFTEERVAAAEAVVGQLFYK